MKKQKIRNIIIALISAFIAFSGCAEQYTLGKFEVDESLIPEYNPHPEPSQEETVINKKGLGLALKNLDWSYKLSDSKVHWHYSWGKNLSELMPDSVEFVPMIWGKRGKNGIDNESVSYLKELKDAGKIKYLLGFNEPDRVDQANMTVEEAIADWPLLEAVGVPLGSPATANPTNNWMREFMALAKEKNLRVDFVTVHSYGGTNANAFLDKLKEVYELFGKPLWITEFGCGDWEASTPEENRHSPEAVLEFMQTVLPELEKLDFVHRYAWFPSNINVSALTSSALWDAEGNFTPLGTFYANFMPNEEIGEGKSPFDPGVVFKDEFENYDVGSNLQQQGYTVWGGSATVQSGEAQKGSQFGQSDISNNDFAIRRTFKLKAGKTYRYEVATKIEDGVKHIVQVHPRATYESSWKDCTNSEWESHSTEFTVQAGSEDVTIALYRWTKKKLGFDEISLTEID